MVKSGVMALAQLGAPQCGSQRMAAGGRARTTATRRAASQATKRGVRRTARSQSDSDSDRWKERGS
jgi:hypothetical protein